MEERIMGLRSTSNLTPAASAEFGDRQTPSATARSRMCGFRNIPESDLSDERGVSRQRNSIRDRQVAH